MSEPFGISDFPAEVAPDLRPSTISSLRLVNRRFWDFFSDDRYYQGYVRYTSPDVAEPAGDPEEGEERRGRWRSTLEEEKRLLTAWRNGRAKRVATVRLPQTTPSRARSHSLYPHGWQEAKDDGGEHWLMRESSSDKKIVIVNLAQDPPVASAIDVAGFTTKIEFSATLFPGRVLIDSGNRSGGELKRVFKIVTGRNELSLQPFFTVEHERGRHVFSGPFYIFFTYSGTVLRLWNMKSGDRLEDIDLSLIVPQEALVYNQRWDQLPCYVHSGEWPMLIMSFYYITYVVVNLESRSLVTWFRNGDRMPVDITLKKNLMMVRSDKLTCIQVYDLRTVGRDLRETPALFRHGVNAMDRVICAYQCEPPNLSVITCRISPDGGVSKIVFASMIGTEEQRVKSTDVRDRRYRGVRFWSVAGPFLVMDHSSATLALDASGEELFDLTDLVREQGGKETRRRGEISFVNEQLRLVSASLSTCILQTQTDDRLFVCQF